MLKKKEFITAVATESKQTSKVVEEVLSGVVSVVTSELKKGEKVAIHGFATFKPVAVPGGKKSFRNPRTGEMVTKQVEDKVKVVVKMEKSLTQSLLTK